MQNTSFWKKRKNNAVQCFLCAHFCVLEDANIYASHKNDSMNLNELTLKSHTGLCRVRKNMHGNLESLINNKIASHNIDPVEKKPLYHFLPNTQTFSLGTMGCNFDCAWCQNSSIAHPYSEENAQEGRYIDTKNIIDACKKYHCPSISFTYNEPTVFFELMFHCAQKAKESNIKTVMVSNGYQSVQLLNTLLPFIDAVNIDLKSFRDSTYQNYCHARLKPVLNTLKRIAKSDTWLEVTTLLIPKLNDSKEELKDIAHFICHELGEHVPWHISAFSPQRNMLDTPRTTKESLLKAYEIGKAQGLKHVYVGNAGITNITKCAQCAETIIIRDNYTTTFASSIIQKDKKAIYQGNSIHEPIKQKSDLPIFDGYCPKCHTKLAGIW